MSSNSPPNYTEGVPIKISEKYKPPPEIKLPTRVLQQLAKANVPMAFDDRDYDFSLERKIISKSSEWTSIRQRERRERQERIHQREVIRQKQIEEEQKLKLNQVSYPSADEISSCDEDEEVTAVAASKTVSEDQTIPTSVEKPFSPTNFNTILLPTQATTADIVNYKKSHRRYASNSSNKIDFSFFESDTSPFDHLEMKSMNEMEMLAEVLGSSTMKNNQATSESNNLERDNSSESDNSTDLKTNNNVTEHQVNQISNNQQHVHQNQHQQQQQHFVPQQIYANSGYYGGSNYYGNFGVNNTSIATAQHQTNHMNYLQNSPHQHHQQQQFNYPQNYATSYHYNGYKTSMMSNNNTIVNDTNGKSDSNQRRNIPSIIQELNDELNNSQRRRNLSQSSQKETIIPEAKPSPTEEQFSKLSMGTQKLATQISQMGFQRDLVIRAVSRIGENDKKVVEHLIPLSELLQMGFEEERVSEALVKFDNDKDRALDYLIS